MADDKSPLDRAVDLFVFAPVGVALTAREELPRFVEKGRQRITGQLTLAKMIGQFAMTQGQRELTKAASRLAKQASEAVERVAAPALFGGAPRAEQPAARRAGPDGSEAGGPRPGGNGARPRSSEQTASAAGAAASARAGVDAPDVATLAIPGYDNLSASQVVQRLAGLSPGELEAVRRYEVATRGRRTILSKAAQLQTGS